MVANEDLTHILQILADRNSKPAARATLLPLLPPTPYTNHLLTTGIQKLEREAEELTIFDRKVYLRSEEMHNLTKSHKSRKWVPFLCRPAKASELPEMVGLVRGTVELLRGRARINWIMRGEERGGSVVERASVSFSDVGLDDLRQAKVTPHWSATRRSPTPLISSLSPCILLLKTIFDDRSKEPCSVPSNS
jgi:hypothetical protein